MKISALIHWYRRRPLFMKKVESDWAALINQPEIQATRCRLCHTNTNIFILPGSILCRCHDIPIIPDQSRISCSRSNGHLSSHIKSLLIIRYLEIPPHQEIDQLIVYTFNGYLVCRNYITFSISLPCNVKTGHWPLCTCSLDLTIRLHETKIELASQCISERHTENHLRWWAIFASSASRIKHLLKARKICSSFIGVHCSHWRRSRAIP